MAVHPALAPFFGTTTGSHRPAPRVAVPVIIVSYFSPWHPVILLVNAARPGSIVQGGSDVATGQPNARVTIPIVIRLGKKRVISVPRRGSHRVLLGFAVPLILLATVSCAHSVRVSRGALDRLSQNGDHFVLVFGSLSTPAGNLDRPAIRFFHPENGARPDALLWTTTIASGQRFYAVLHAPGGAEYLDQFFVEAGSEIAGFDRILWTHLRKDQEPLAMYVGEIEVRPALNRAAQGQKVVVETRDDMQNAQRDCDAYIRAFYEPRKSWPPNRGWTGGFLRSLAPRPAALALCGSNHQHDSYTKSCAAPVLGPRFRSMIDGCGVK